MLYSIASHHGKAIYLSIACRVAHHYDESSVTPPITIAPAGSY